MNKKYKYSSLVEMSDSELNSSLSDIKRMLFMSRFQSVLDRSVKNKRFPSLLRRFVARIKTEVNDRRLLASGKKFQQEAIIIKKVKYRD